MKFTSVFTAVLALHLFVISILLIQPGCSTGTQQHSSDATVLDDGQSVTPMGEPIQAYSVDSGQSFNAVPAARHGLQSPSRPSWSSFDEPSATTARGEERVEILQPVSSATATAAAAAPRMSTYEVQRGDSLWKIARDHGVTLEALLQANQLQKDAVIRVGQEIRIPGEGGSLPSAAEQAQSYATDRSQSVGEATSKHKVQRGDTLSGLARQYGTTVAAIQAANGLSGTTIRLDQELIIPAAGAAGAVTGPAATSTTPATAQGGNSYVVKAGDTLDAIARRHGVRSADLMRDNNISDPRRLRIGQTLILRGTGSAPAVEAKPAAAPKLPSTPQQREEAAQQDVDGLPASPSAVPVNTVPRETQPIDPLDALDDVPIVATEESN